MRVEKWALILPHSYSSLFVSSIVLLLMTAVHQPAQLATFLMLRLRGAAIVERKHLHLCSLLSIQKNIVFSTIQMPNYIMYGCILEFAVGAPLNWPYWHGSSLHKNVCSIIVHLLEILLPWSLLLGRT